MPSKAFSWEDAACLLIRGAHIPVARLSDLISQPETRDGD